MDISNTEKFNEVTSCTNCPCLNFGYEEGYECNLEYDTGLFLTKNDKTITASFNCGLSTIEYKNGTFKPKLVLVRKINIYGK